MSLPLHQRKLEAISARVFGGKRYIFIKRPLKKGGWTLQV
jgi:hypothetical protein